MEGEGGPVMEHPAHGHGTEPHDEFGLAVRNPVRKELHSEEGYPK